MAGPREIISTWFKEFAKPSKKFGDHILVTQRNEALNVLFARLQDSGCTREDVEQLAPAIAKSCNPKKHGERKKLDAWKEINERVVAEYIEAMYGPKPDSPEVEKLAQAIAVKVATHMKTEPKPDKWWRLGTADVDFEQLRLESDFEQPAFKPDPGIDELLGIDWDTYG